MFRLTNSATGPIDLKQRRQPIRLDVATSTRFVLSLFLVFALAKLLVIAHRHSLPSPWIAGALFGQDALSAIAVGLLLALIARRLPIASWFSYALLCVYAALNVPLTLALSSPLTLQISQAAGGALTDSINHYLTATNFLFMTVVLLAGCFAPLLIEKIRRPLALTFAVALVLLGVASAPFARRGETAGLDRSPIIAFITSCLPKISAEHANSDWRKSAVTSIADPDRHALRGALAGRNVIMIALESTAARYLSMCRPSSCAGRLQQPTLDPMPNLSALSRDALIADNAYCVYPESIKGLFSVLCSRYPAFDTSAERLARSSSPSIGDILRAHTYRTALFHSGRFMYLGMDSIIQNRGFETLEDAGAISGNFNSSFGVDEPATVQRVLGWIDTLKAGERFFLMYLPIAGHHPYDIPQPGPFPVRTEQDRYLNALNYGDRSLGEFFAGLKQRQLFTNTVFIVFGDHGEGFGQHDGNYAHSLFLYEENVHVPFLIAAPGKLCGETRLQNPMSLIDVAPTILDLIGINIPPAFQGSSLLHREAQMSLFYTDYSLPLLGLRDGHYKFIAELGASRNQLYDLAVDPSEGTNLSACFPARTSAYRQRLERWAAAQKAAYQDGKR